MKYLTDEIHEWALGSSSRTNGDYDDIYRAYQLWKHAQELLVSSDHELYRSDCIANLKRAINHRLQAIERIYKISKLPLEISSKKVLDRYEYLGLIRPMVLNELIKVRNVIEHQDQTPPEKEKCVYYIDIVWYFLKSTDSLVDNIVESVEYIDDEDNVVTIDVSPGDNWVFTACLKIEASLLSAEHKAQYIELSEIVSPNETGRVIARVELKPNTKQLLTLVNEYFGSASFWHEDRFVQQLAV
ncbi:hypothetical protein [Vibrio mytili]|uniref:hypothetical protein n=1 Tax=Vibrio mytili TaxID=50718 RepID=UPI000697FB45|nr:hypothetical protein [Vibrio mytili]